MIHERQTSIERGNPMKRYMERIWELMNDAKMKHHIALYDEATPKVINYEQLRMASGRVYAYLKAQHEYPR